MVSDDEDVAAGNKGGSGAAEECRSLLRVEVHVGYHHQVEGRFRLVLVLVLLVVLDLAGFGRCAG